MKKNSDQGLTLDSIICYISLRPSKGEDFFLSHIILVEKKVLAIE